MAGLSTVDMLSSSTVADIHIVLDGSAVPIAPRRACS